MNLRRLNPKNIIQGVATLKSQELKRVVPTAKGGEMPTLQTYRTDVSTYFTEASSESKLLYTAENWVVVKLTLETAGPVAVGTNADVAPVLSGKGRLLDTGVEYSISVARGTSLYIAAEAINRVSFTVEPIPWAEQLAAEITQVARVVSSTVQSVGSAIVSAIGTLTGKPAAPTSNTGRRMEDLPTPRLPRQMAPRLTPAKPPGKVR